MPSFIPPSDRAPYALPLSPDGFRRALYTGHGRAFLHAERHGLDGVLDDVLQAMLTHRCFWQQIHGGRAVWLLDMLESAGALVDVLPKLQEELPMVEFDNSDDSIWDLRQRDDALVLLHLRGQTWALDSLQTAIAKRDESWGFPEGSDALIEAMGPDALAWLAPHFVNLEECRSGAPWSEVEKIDEDHDQGTSLGVLDAARATCPAAEVLFQALLDSSRNPSPRPERPAWNLKDLLERIEDFEGKEQARWELRAGNCARAARDATEVDLMFLAQEWTIANTDWKRMAFAACFTFHPLPLLDQSFLDQTGHANVAIARFARRALKHTTDPRIRELALAHVRSPDIFEDWLLLLYSNYEPGDHVQIEAALEPHEDPDVLDSLTWDLWKLGELPHPELAGTQLFVYEHSPCGYCRRKALENLLRFDRVPDWVRDEAVHDGCDDTRAWAREHLGAG